MAPVTGSLPAGLARTYMGATAATEKHMTRKALRLYDARWKPLVLLVLALALGPVSRAFAADEPDLIFRRSTVFKLLSPNDKLATYGVDDPEVDGVACHFTVPEKGGIKGWWGSAGRFRIFRWHAVRSARSISRTRWSRAAICSASAVRCSSRRCKSSAAATPTATCWFTWPIRTGLSR